MRLYRTPSSGRNICRLVSRQRLWLVTGGRAHGDVAGWSRGGQKQRVEKGHDVTRGLHFHKLSTALEDSQHPLLKNKSCFRYAVVC